MNRNTLFLLVAVAFRGLLFASVGWAGEVDRFRQVGRNPDGPGNENWKVARWLGDEGRGMADRAVRDPEDETVMVFRLEGGGNAETVTENRIVFWLNKSQELQAGKEYEFRARLKTENVAGRVGLVAAVRAGGVRDARSEDLSGSRDWTDVSLRFKVTEDSRARFFAVDFWGAGTVWIGQIALLERDPTPLELILHQETFNLADRIAWIDARIGVPDLAGLKIRFELEMEGGQQPVLNEFEVTGPNMAIQIDISELQAGNHAVWAQLRDKERVLARKRFIITKTAGLLDF